MNIKWIPAYVAVNAQNEPVGVLYTKNGHSPFPQVQTPTEALQGLQMASGMEQVRLPTNMEKVKRAYNA